jgi:hypothetical protein
MCSDARLTHLLDAVVTGSASSGQEPPRAAQHAGEDGGGAVVRGGLGVGAQRPRAGQHVVHGALPDAYPLRGALEHVEQQGYEPQQHQLCTNEKVVRTA